VEVSKCERTAYAQVLATSTTSCKPTPEGVVAGRVLRFEALTRTSETSDQNESQRSKRLGPLDLANQSQVHEKARSLR
jgi:hypothetical protein